MFGHLWCIRQVCCGSFRCRVVSCFFFCLSTYMLLASELVFGTSISLEKRILLFYKQIKHTSFADQAVFYCRTSPFILVKAHTTPTNDNTSYLGNTITIF
jgi:hypothetical protein